MNTATMTEDYHCSITAKTSAKDAYACISRVYSWWASNFEGSAQKLDDVFTVRFGETWVTFKITEAIANETITWHILDCCLPWLADKKEWKNTDVLWEISSNDDITRVDMTHVGLVPAIECYGNCEQGWNHYIKGSLHKLLSGEPQNYEATISVRTNPEDAIKAINDISAWWAIDTIGCSAKAGDTFTVRFGKTFSTIKIAEWLPGRKIVWEVLECNMDLLADKKEWQGTKIVWDITVQGDKTQITMTHVGLTPVKECYNDCKNGWNFFIRESLSGLLTRQKGLPARGIRTTVANDDRVYQGMMYYKHDPLPRIPEGSVVIDIKETKVEHVVSSWSVTKFEKELKAPPKTVAIKIKN